MKAFVFCWLAAFAAAPAWAQQEKAVDGLVIDLGIMSAEKAVHAEGHRDAHPSAFPSGSQHILITVVDAKTRARIADATVVVAVRSPFVFPSSGTYQLRVKITPAHGPKSTLTAFTVHHEI